MVSPVRNHAYGAFVISQIFITFLLGEPNGIDKGVIAKPEASRQGGVVKRQAVAIPMLFMT